MDQNEFVKEKLAERLEKIKIASDYLLRLVNNHESGLEYSLQLLSLHRTLTNLNKELMKHAAELINEPCYSCDRCNRKCECQEKKKVRDILELITTVEY